MNLRVLITAGPKFILDLDDSDEPGLTHYYLRTPASDLVRSSLQRFLWSALSPLITGPEPSHHQLCELLGPVCSPS